MEYLVVLGILGLGYKLQSDNKNKNLNRKTLSKVPKSQIPSVDTVYESNRAYDIFQNEQKKANVLLEKSKYPEDTNVVTPGPPFPIMYNKVDYNESNLPIEFNSYTNYDNIMIDTTDDGKQIDINLIKNNKTLPNTGGFSGISLTGDNIDPTKFTHNNMVPFFGGNVRQNLDEFSTRGIFENFTGTQDSYQKKQEQGLFFQPQKNMSNVYGTGNLDGYMYDRYYVSNIRSNETPIEKVYVGPGLNQGYTNEPSGGFQQPDAQDYSMPKTVDELRVVSGQKIAKPAKIGTVYKNRPDTFYVQEPDRYFTTTGQVIAPEQRPCIVTKYTNRKTTELKTRTGSAAPIHGTVAQVRSKYKISNKITYADEGPRNLDGAGTWNILDMFGFKSAPHDYGKQSIRVRDNKRVLNNENDKGNNIINLKAPNGKGVARNGQKLKETKKIIKNNRINGNFQGGKKSVVYDPNNIPRATIKETNIHNNHSGMLSTNNKGVAYDPNDIARTTIKETNIHNNHEGVFQNTGASRGIAYDPNDVTRTTIKETNIHNNHEGVFQNTGASRGIAYDPNDVTRTTIKETNIHNNHEGVFQNTGASRGIAYDPNAIARTTIKETNIHNNHEGVFQNTGASRGTVYDPNDIARTTIKETNIHNEYNSNIQNMNRGNVVYDPNAVARTTIKETNIHNNHKGSMQNTGASRGAVYDPSNTARTTMKQTTIKNKRKANIDGTGKGIYIKNNDKMKTTTKQTTMVHNAMGGATQMRGDGHLVKGIQVPHTIREDTSTQYMGDAQGREMGGYDVTDVNAPNTNRQFTADTEHFGGVGNDGVNIKPMSYEDIYNAEIKAIRGDIDEGYTPGAMGPNNGVSSDSLNVTTTRMGDIQNQYLSERGVQANKVYNSIPQLVSANLTQEKEIVPNEPLADRINPDIIKAFQENPYTQSLTSWA